MNLLVTNAQEVQAYTIVRALRPVASRIVLTQGGDSVASTGFRGMAAYSRFVDAKYEVPHFAADWLAGRLESENTADEERYVRRIEEICAEEGIDVIFPSLDPEVYLFAKNKKRLAALGVLVVVPEPEVIRVPMDKALTLQAAQRVGFPCPQTFYPNSEADVAAIVETSTPPWIVKPRFTAHGAHMRFVRDADELAVALRSVSSFQTGPIVQEFIAGSARQNYYVTVDREGNILSLLSPEVTRTYSSAHRVSSKTCISASTAPCVEELRTLLAELSVWGPYTVQTKVDPRDGVPKLLEINARVGQHLWWRTGLGVNEPLICLQLARGETPSGNFVFPDGVMLLDPFHDLSYLYDRVVERLFAGVGKLLGRDMGESASAPENDNPSGVFETLKHYRRDYFNRRRKLISPEFSALFSDPYPCLRAFAHKFGGMSSGYWRRGVRAVKKSSSQATEVSDGT